MGSFIHIIEHHGYLALAVIVFLEAIGLPIPAAVALVVAGSAAALHVLSPTTALFVGVVGVLIGDVLLFELGRRSGWALLGILCRVSMNPETCILRSAESFYKRGRLTLVFAKFVPGVNTMAPPLAGSMRMPFLQFLRLDLAGTLVYVLAYGGVGFLFSRILKDILRGFERAGYALEIVFLVALMAYVAYRAYVYWTHRVYRVVPRAQVSELIARRDSGEELVVADVRSHGYYDAGTQRIRGSIRFEPNNFHDAVKLLPKDKPIFLYCT
jgi:membrane protein DedA with SNARE-associated domain